MRIAAVIPTYNEVELVSACVDSLLSQGIPNLEVVVVNAGDPLPEILTAKITELKVPSSYFWTACIDAGVQEVKSRCDYLLFTNADTTFLPNSLIKLIEAVESDPKAIACSPAYLQVGDEPLSLLYSHQSDMGPLLYGRLIRLWNGLEDAPSEKTTVDLTGGQGVLMPVSIFQTASMDTKRFPHYCSDHDLWLQARKAGYRLILVPQAGIVNKRDFNTGQNKDLGRKIQALWKRMSSEYTPESWILMWRLRRKHQGLILGTATAMVSFGLRWTVGLRKILRRT